MSRGLYEENLQVAIQSFPQKFESVKRLCCGYLRENGVISSDLNGLHDWSSFTTDVVAVYLLIPRDEIGVWNEQVWRRKEDGSGVVQVGGEKGYWSTVCGLATVSSGVFEWNVVLSRLNGDEGGLFYIGITSKWDGLDRDGRMFYSQFDYDNWFATQMGGDRDWYRNDFSDSEIDGFVTKCVCFTLGDPHVCFDSKSVFSGYDDRDSYLHQRKIGRVSFGDLEERWKVSGNYFSRRDVKIILDMNVGRVQFWLNCVLIVTVESVDTSVQYRVAVSCFLPDVNQNVMSVQFV